MLVCGSVIESSNLTMETIFKVRHAYINTLYKSILALCQSLSGELQIRPERNY